jgi:hypothetical protein
MRGIREAGHPLRSAVAQDQQRPGLGQAYVRGKDGAAQQHGQVHQRGAQLVGEP